ncbi:hypothetical protein LP43_0646 [Methylophaga thiooxydans]|uniref:Uncharacterized protein n=1 Tax=Methylophaga thiooxydans TaxID=392484 RepID=A0A0A0BIB4_9GAMM|nr:hypothetical protein [Methylophaga thiooxydans]KGM08223.1 hypothetical protein LP43_0646 [Methylophaga thiooxydans]
MDKQQELDCQRTLEGLEELATFMSYRSDCSGLRILTIETIGEAEQRESAERRADVISIERRRRLKHQPITISKELRFNDLNFHS